jgi:hypothetical protein
LYRGAPRIRQGDRAIVCAMKFSRRITHTIAASAVALGAISISSAIATASAAADATAVTQGTEASIGDVPWSALGPGWTLATWSPVTPQMPGVETPPGEPTWETASTTPQPRWLRR